jgi:hypothetical protein
MDAGEPVTARQQQRERNRQRDGTRRNALAAQRRRGHKGYAILRLVHLELVDVRMAGNFILGSKIVSEPPRDQNKNRDTGESRENKPETDGFEAERCGGLAVHDQQRQTRLQSVRTSKQQNLQTTSGQDKSRKHSRT